jgi:hypothetical protein
MHLRHTFVVYCWTHFASRDFSAQKRKEISPMAPRMSYIFSGHQTFVLRASWLKRLYDELVINPRVLNADDAVVRLGVGKNMVDAMRYWAVVTQMIAPHADGGFMPTPFAHTLLADDGIDPFLVTPWARMEDEASMRPAYRDDLRRIREEWGWFARAFLNQLNEHRQ